MQNNECVYISDQFTDYRENTLSSEIKAKVDAHLAVCSPCRNIFQELENVLDTLHKLPLHQARPDFTKALLSRIDDIDQESLWHKFSHSTVSKVAGYAIAAGLVVALGLNMLIDPISPIDPNGKRSFTEEQMNQSVTPESLAEQADSSNNQQADSLALHHNAINPTGSSLQLVSDTK